MKFRMEFNDEVFQQMILELSNAEDGFSALNITQMQIADFARMETGKFRDDLDMKFKTPIDHNRCAYY